MKFAVHWAPAVNSCTPGWMAALDEGAHVGAAVAVAPSASGASAPATTSTATTDAARRTCLTQETRTVSLPARRRAGSYPVRPPSKQGSGERALDGATLGVYAVGGELTEGGPRERTLAGLAQRRAPRHRRRRLRRPHPGAAGADDHRPGSPLRRLR